MSSKENPRPGELWETDQSRCAAEKRADGIWRSPRGVLCYTQNQSPRRLIGYTVAYVENLRTQAQAEIDDLKTSAEEAETEARELAAEVTRLRTEVVAADAATPPCDRGCVAAGEADQECSRHGLSPRTLHDELLGAHAALSEAVARAEGAEEALSDVLTERNEARAERDVWEDRAGEVAWKLIEVQRAATVMAQSRPGQDAVTDACRPADIESHCGEKILAILGDVTSPDTVVTSPDTDLTAIATSGGSCEQTAPPISQSLVVVCPDCAGQGRGRGRAYIRWEACGACDGTGSISTSADYPPGPLSAPGLQSAAHTLQLLAGQHYADPHQVTDLDRAHRIVCERLVSLLDAEAGDRDE